MHATHLAAKLALELLVLVPGMDLPPVRLQVVEELAHVAAVLARKGEVSRVLLLVLPPPLVPDHGGAALVAVELLVRQLVGVVPRVVR